MGSTKRENKRFYWLKLPENFFQRNDIKLIESQKNGALYLIFYLKLMTESIEFNGELRFNELIPFDEEMLATITGTDIDVVRTSMKLFVNLGLIEIFNDQTIYMIETAKLLGSETASTIRSRVSRANKENKEAIETAEIVALQHNSNTNATESKSKSKSIELDKEKELLSEDIENNQETDENLDNNSQQQHISFDFVKDIFLKMNLKSNVQRFYDYYKNMNWRFHNGKPITEKAIQRLAYNWERNEEKFIDSPEVKEIFTEELGNVIGG